MQWNQKCCHFTIISYCYIIVYILLAHCFSSTMYFFSFLFCNVVWIQHHHQRVYGYAFIFATLPSWCTRYGHRWVERSVSVLPNDSRNDFHQTAVHRNGLDCVCYAMHDSELCSLLLFCGLHSFIWLATKCDDDSCCYCFFFFGLVWFLSLLLLSHWQRNNVRQISIRA